MSSGVLIVFEGLAEDFLGQAVPGSYFARVEERPSGGITVVWSDLPDEAMVFDDLASAEAFSRQEPLTLFEVSFASAPASAQAPTAPATPPDPISLADEMRAMGLM